MSDRRNRYPNGYWTYDRCKEESLKYNKLNDIPKRVKDLIHKNKWYELISHISYKTSNGYWTYERCKEEILKYTTIYDLIKNSGGCYNSIKKNNWNTLIINLRKKRPNGYWTYERCKEEALKYNNKTELQKKCGGVYNIIKRNRWSELTSHMELLGNKYKRLIYVYEFDDKCCYVGLTGNIKRRKHQHINEEKNSSVYKHMHKTKLVPSLVIKTDYIDVRLAISFEEKYLNEYKSNGWIILNKVKTGGIGSYNIIWNKEACKKEALKYNKITNYQYFSKSSYNAALKNEWIDEVCSHMKRCKSKSGFWNNKELCKNETLKYKNVSEFRINNWSAYNYSRLNGWLYEFYKL